MILKSLCAAFVLLAPALGPASAEAQDAPRSTATPAFKGAIPNIPGKSLIAVVVEYPPGGKSPSHHHAASAFIYAHVLAGAVRSQVDDQPVGTHPQRFAHQPGKRHGSGALEVRLPSLQTHVVGMAHAQFRHILDRHDALVGRDAPEQRRQQRGDEQDPRRERAGDLPAAMRLIAAEGRGVVVLLRDLSPLLPRPGEASPHTLRQYGVGAQILAALGIHELVLLTNTAPLKVVGLDGYGLAIHSTRPIPQD